MTKPFDAILFDFGGVFTDSPFHAVQAFGEKKRIDPNLVTTIVFGSYEQDGAHPWHQLERGEISLERCRDLILAHGQEQGLQVDIYELFAEMAGNNAGADTKAVLVERVRALRDEGYVTGIITNNVAEFGDGWRSLIPVDELFEFVIDSSVVGLRKPDPRIFQLAIDRLDAVPPERILFLDDFQGNVDAAQALGMQTIVVGPDAAQTVSDLNSLL